MEKIGPEDNYTLVNKYTTRQLLDPEFRIPFPSEQEDFGDIFGKTDGIIYDEVK